MLKLSDLKITVIGLGYVGLPLVVEFGKQLPVVGFDIQQKSIPEFSVHDKFHRTLILSGFCFLKIAKISLNSSFFPKPIKR